MTVLSASLCRLGITISACIVLGCFSAFMYKKNGWAGLSGLVLTGAAFELQPAGRAPSSPVCCESIQDMFGRVLLAIISSAVVVGESAVS